MKLSWWLPALGISMLVHLAAATLFGETPEQELVAGGASAEIAVAGNAFVDALRAGTDQEIVSELETETVETDIPEPVQPTTSAAPETTPAEVLEPVEITPPELVLDPSDPIDAQAVVLTIAEAVVPETLPEAASLAEPVQQVPAEAFSAEASPIETLSAEPISSEPLEVMAEAIEAPIPPIRTVPSIPRSELYAQTTPPAPRSQGSGGTSNADAVRGSAGGNQNATATTQSQTGGNSAEGNAAVTNYPGQVASKLRRALRYPSAARGATGEASVQFTIDAAGNLLSSSLVSSTGNATLDQAALATVQRASPFPPIPPAANRNQWTFTMPLGFVR